MRVDGSTDLHRGLQILVKKHLESQTNALVLIGYEQSDNEL